MTLSDLPLFRPVAPVAGFTIAPAPRHPVAATDVPRQIGSDTPLDWQVVVQLRRRASVQITDAVREAGEDKERPLTGQDRRLLARSLIRTIVREYAESLSETGAGLWSLPTEHAYGRAVEDAIFGYGRMQPLFEIRDAENIEITGCDVVRVQFPDGRRETRPPVADTDEELVEAIRFLGEMATPSRPFDDVHPTMTLALGDRFRLHAIGFGLAQRPVVTVRQHLLTSVTLSDLAASGMMPDHVAWLLHEAVLARMSIVIAGDQGAGKTTLLRALIASIPMGERFGTLETDYELLTHLQPGREHIVALQARVGMGEFQDGRRVGEVTVADLIPEALRQNLSRIIVGEVRGAEAGAMFTAMQSGAGSMSTTHSHSAAGIMDRLASRAAQDGSVTVAEAYRQIAHHISLLVHVRLDDETWRGGRRTRYVAEIRRVTGGMESDRPTTHLVYRSATPTSGEVFHPDPDLVAELAPFHDGTWPR